MKLYTQRLGQVLKGSPGGRKGNVWGCQWQAHPFPPNPLASHLRTNPYLAIPHPIGTGQYMDKYKKKGGNMKALQKWKEGKNQQTRTPRRYEKCTFGQATHAALARQSEGEGAIRAKETATASQMSNILLTLCHSISRWHLSAVGFRISVEWLCRSWFILPCIWYICV